MSRPGSAAVFLTGKQQVSRLMSATRSKSRLKKKRPTHSYRAASNNLTAQARKALPNPDDIPDIV